MAVDPASSGIMKMSEIQAEFPARVMDFDLACEAFTIPADVANRLRNVPVPFEVLKALHKQEPLLIFPLPGSSLKDLSEISFKKLGIPVNPGETNTLSLSTLISQERKQFAEAGRANKFISEEEASLTKSINSRLRAAKAGEGLPDFYTGRELFVPEIDQRLLSRLPIYTRRGDSEWVVASLGQTPMKNERVMELTELVATAMVAASIHPAHLPLHASLEGAYDLERQRVHSRQEYYYQPSTIVGGEVVQSGRYFPRWQINDGTAQPLLDPRGNKIPVLQKIEVAPIARPKRFMSATSVSSYGAFGISSNDNEGISIIKSDTNESTATSLKCVRVGIANN